MRKTIDEKMDNPAVMRSKFTGSAPMSARTTLPWRRGRAAAVQVTRGAGLRLLGPHGHGLARLLAADLRLICRVHEDVDDDDAAYMRTWWAPRRPTGEEIAPVHVAASVRAATTAARPVEVARESPRASSWVF